MGIGWWHYRPDSTERIVYHLGGTYGQTSFLGFSKSSKRGIVILSNFSGDHPKMKSGKDELSKPNDLAFQILTMGQLIDQHGSRKTEK